MKKILNKITIVAVIASIAIGTPSCNKEYINPSAGSVPSVTTNVDALMNLCAGMQRRFTVGRQSPLYNAPIGGTFGVYGLNTLNAGNITEAALQAGKGAVQPGNSTVTQLWGQCLLLKTEAETVLDNLSVATDPADKVGLKAYASIFYALSLGTLAQFYEQIPLTKGINATFSPRIDALQKAITVLESVDADLATTNPSAKFLGKVPAGIDAKNTVKALLARYYNMHSMATGTYNAVSGNKAITFAGVASTTVKSEFRFAAATPNPLGEQNVTVNVYGAIDSSLGMRNGLTPTPWFATDPRIGFHISKVGGNYPLKGFATALTSSYPVYLPGEMSLIIAENYARQSLFPQSKTALDIVRTKVTDVFGIGAAQPAYSGTMDQPSLLTDIYKQRRIELFMSGMELEDSRRFGRPAPNSATEERNRNFYPYPFTERDNNTNTPADPAI
jgi:starch-binding outer membrane protein, SusD/RagB family